MRWFEVRIESDKDITESASIALLEAGAGGTQIQNPEEIKSQIDEAGANELASYRDFSHIMDVYSVTAYFSTETDLDALKAALNIVLTDFEFLWREVDDSEWSGNWKKYYKAFNLTKDIRVVPSWEAEGTPDEHTIIMDPGMAFGTGTHESTELCAGLLEDAITPGDVVLDIGTGTGILSILAARKKAALCIALDIDSAAVKTAKENFEGNNVSNAVVYQGELKDISAFLQKKKFKAAFDTLNKTSKAAFKDMFNPNEGFDLVAANIVSGIIIELAPDIKRYLKKGGSLVCSGIITERELEVLAALEAEGFKNPVIHRKNEWTAILVNA